MCRTWNLTDVSGEGVSGPSAGRPRPGEAGSGTCAPGSILPPRGDAAAAPQAGAQKHPRRGPQAGQAGEGDPRCAACTCGSLAAQAQGRARAGRAPRVSTWRAPTRTCAGRPPSRGGRWTPRPEPSPCAPARRAVCLPLHDTLREWRPSAHPRTKARLVSPGRERRVDSQLSDSQSPWRCADPSQPSWGGRLNPRRAPGGAEVLTGSPGGTRTRTAGRSQAHARAGAGAARVGSCQGRRLREWGRRGGRREAGAH